MQVMGAIQEEERVFLVFFLYVFDFFLVPYFWFSSTLFNTRVGLSKCGVLWEIFHPIIAPNFLKCSFRAIFFVFLYFFCSSATLLNTGEGELSFGKCLML